MCARVKTAFAAVSLAVAVVGCGGGGSPTEEIPSCENRGDMYFAGITKTTTDGIVSVDITSAEPAPPANSYTNDWNLLITDATTGAPVEGALVIAAPYMVNHGHGAPNVIADEAGAGVYVIDPLSLKMNGLWDVTMKVTPQGGVESRTVFSFCVLPI